MSETFGQFLRRLRLRAGMTVSELAEAVGADRKSIGLWEQGRRVPRDRARLLDLIQVLDVSGRDAELFTLAWRQARPGGDDVPDDTAVSEVLPISGPRYQLRAPVADFVGRELEITRLVRVLQSALAHGRGAIISAVQGMAGIGKTELAYVVAHQLRHAFPDAQIALNLRGLSTAPLTTMEALLAVIRLFTPEVRLPDDLEVLQHYYRSVLHGKRVLILADDAKDARHVRSLIPPVGSALLVTSRQRFTLSGMVTVHLEQLCAEEGIALVRSICERLRLDEAQALVQACGHLPLALRISGGILSNDPALDPSAYIQKLADEQYRLSQLRDPDDSHLDVAATLALSYMPMDSVSQRVFRQLSVFIADFTIAMVLAVVDVPPGVDVEAILHRLLRRNLVMYDEAHTRWRLHDLVRDLARGYLDSLNETEAVMWRYAQAAIAITQTTRDQYRAGGEEMLAALAQFDTERPHIDAGQHWATAHVGTPQGDRLLLDLVLATREICLLRYDVRRNTIPQGQSALAAARRLGDQHAEGLVLDLLGNAYAELGENRQAIPYFEQYLTIAGANGDHLGESIGLGNLGIAYWQLGDLHQAIAIHTQSLALAEAFADQFGECAALCNLGNVYTHLGKPGQALAVLERALAIIQALGDRHGEGIVLINLGDAMQNLGEVHGAREYCTQSLTLARMLGDRCGEGIALYHLGRADLALGEVALAIERCKQARDILRVVGAQQEEAHALRTLAASYIAFDAWVQARAAFEDALSLSQAVGDRWGTAECQWFFGLALMQHGEHKHALSLLQAAVAYKQDIGHAKAVEYAALLARLEAGKELSPDLHVTLDQRAIGDDSNRSTADKVQP